MHPTKFRFIWQAGFREDFLEINRSEIRIFCGGHVCGRFGKKRATATEDFPQMLPSKFRFIWPNGFRVEESKKSAIQKQESHVAAMFANGSGQNQQCLQKTFHRCFLPYLGLIWQSSFREEDFQKSTILKQELPFAALFVNGSGRNEQSLQKTCRRCILSSFGSFGQTVSEEKMLQKSTNQQQELSVGAMFFNGSEGNQQSQQRTFHGCFLPRFGSFGEVVSEEKNLKNQPVRKKNPIWRHVCQRIKTEWIFFIEDFPQMFSTKFRIIWLSGFRGEDFQKSTNQKQILPVATMCINGSGRNEQYLQKTSHRCILPSFGSFGEAVSEEKICQKSTNQKQELSVGTMFVNGSGINEQS